jgi:anti-sigma factor RsiW
MKCSRSKLVSPYVDGELEAEDKARFEKHAEGCPECGAMIEKLQQVRSLFSHAEGYQAPYGFKARVMAKTREAGARRPVWRPLFVGFAEVAVVLAMIFVGSVSGRFLVNTVLDQQAGDFASSFSLDLFEPAPPDSLGGVYLAMTEANNEK